MKTWPSWLFGSTVGASRRTLPSTSPAPRILIRAAWLTWSFAISRVGTMPTRSNSPRAMIENSASPLPEASAPTTAVEFEIMPAIGACTCTLPPSGRFSRASTCPAETVSPASTSTSATFNPKRSGRTAVSSRGMQDAGHLDVVAEAEFRGLQHRDRRPLGRRLGFLGVGSRGDQAQHSGRHQDGPFRLYGARGLLVHGPSISN